MDELQNGFSTGEFLKTNSVARAGLNKMPCLRNTFGLALWWFAFFQLPLCVAAQSENDSLWKAGVARVIITPQQSMWMAGFAARDHESEGTLHDLWAKALAIEDSRGNKAVMVSTDLLGFPKGLSDRIRARVKERYGLDKAQVLLNSSHTHSAPVLNNALRDVYPLDESQLKKVAQYTSKLEDQIVDLVGKALRSLKPAQLFAANGVSRFQINRRNNPAATLSAQTDLNGPNDYAVPVIKVMDESGKLQAVAFGYACHNTVLNGYDWSGDYAGFAQIELEKMYPGVTAMFFAGAGADQNPLPRSSVPLARQYGRDLAAAVARVLEENMGRIGPGLSTAYREVPLGFARLLSKDDYARMANELTGYQKRWATRMQQKVERGESLPTSYPYPLQVWKLGNQNIFSLGGELVVGYAIELKKIFGQDSFVFGYSNDVMAYIPTTTILREGGYEGQSSQMVYGLPASWSSDIESVILYEMVKLAREAGVSAN